MAYQDDKYETYFRAIVAGTSRPALLTFATCSVAAVARRAVEGSEARLAVARCPAEDSGNCLA